MNTIKLNKFGIFVFVLLFLFIFLSIFLYIKIHSIQKNNFTDKEIPELSLEQKVSKLVVLPENEEPTILEIKNVEQIKNEPFFTNAKLGDNVLVYVGIKKAFLYRPSENKIVDIAPLVINEE